MEMIRSTSQMKSMIIVKISSLKACFRSDRFLFITLINVQITKKMADPMIVCRMKVGDLKAHAYYVSE